MTLKKYDSQKKKKKYDFHFNCLSKPEYKWKFAQSESAVLYIKKKLQQKSENILNK